MSDFFITFARFLENRNETDKITIIDTDNAICSFACRLIDGNNAGL